MTECFKGWSKEDGNKKGRCCCNCQHQVKVHSHPLNVMTGGRLKGPITSIAGYACANKEVTEGNFIIFMEQQHDVCEVHEFKKI